MAKPQCKPTLLKPDLASLNFKKSLTSKVDELLKQCEVTKMETVKKDSINQVMKDVALRVKTTKPHELDQRCQSPAKYVEKGFLKDAKSPVKENLKDSHLQQRYHNAQYELFNQVSDIFPGILNNYQQKKDTEGLWFLYDKKGTTSLTTDEFVNFIDKITKKFIEKLKQLNPKKLTPADIDQKEEDVQTVAEFCQEIVMGRYLADLNVETDLMDDEETKPWKGHVSIIISFSALLVILEMLKLRRRPKSKTKKPINQNSLNIKTKKPINQNSLDIKTKKPINQNSNFLYFFIFSIIMLIQLKLYGFSLNTGFLLFLLLLWVLDYACSRAHQSKESENE